VPVQPVPEHVPLVVTSDPNVAVSVAAVPVILNAPPSASTLVGEPVMVVVPLVPN